MAQKFEEKWDIVVLTSMDVAQKEAFEIQLEQIGPLPNCIAYRVYNDEPPGIRIGGGGSAILALRNLHNEFGDELFTKKILLLLAGGLSQRQPNGTVLGKVFTLVPAESNRPCTIFELKLNIYSKFLPAMKTSGGVLLVAADTLEYFGFDNYANEANAVTLADNGFTVVAHPSPLEVGVDHGVYVIDRDAVPKVLTETSCFLAPVKKVLQKPTIQEMRNWKAVVTDSTSTKEFVYSDSCYFFAWDVGRRLLKLNPDEIRFEVDAYGDFLQPLGVDSTTDYVEKSSSVELASYKHQLYGLLSDSPVQALIFPKSVFYHLGTFRELLHFYCTDNEFLQKFRLTRQCFVDIQRNQQEDFEKVGQASLIDACVMCSRLKFDSIISAKTVVEICDFQAGIEIGSECILSNCASSRRHKIPANIFLSTMVLAVGDKKSTKFVTVVFNVDENLKCAYVDLNEIRYLNRKLVDVLSTWNMNLHATKLFDTVHPMSLWFAKLFPAFDFPDESFDDAVERVCLATCQEKNFYASNSPAHKKSKISNNEVTHYYSMYDCVALKDVRNVLTNRERLFAEIDQSLTEKRC